MSKYQLCWTDIASQGSCCPALHEGIDDYVVQGVAVDEVTRLTLSAIDDHEVAVSTPKNVLDLLIADEAVLLEGNYLKDADLADRYERLAGMYMLPWAAHLVSMVCIRPGDRVLDLACGTGFVSRQIVNSFGSSVDLVAVDPHPAMAFEAMRRNPTVEVRRAMAESMDLSPMSFDVVLCQQGMQYFADPELALSEAWRLLKPGGQILLSSWAAAEQNPFLFAQVECMRRYLRPSTLESLRAHTVTKLGGEVGVDAMLAGVGFAQVETSWQRLDLPLGSFEDYVLQLVENSSWGGVFHTLPAHEQDEVVDFVKSSVSWSTSRPIAQMTALTALATRPHSAN